MAEKGIAMAKENYDKMKSSAEEATDVLEETYTTASKGCSGYGLKVIEAGRANANAAFDLMTELLTAKSYAEVVELSTAFMRKQFDTVTAQAKELAEEAQKVCDRHRRADQGKLHQRLQQGGLTTPSAPRERGADRKPGQRPGLSLCGLFAARAARGKRLAKPAPRT